MSVREVASWCRTCRITHPRIMAGDVGRDCNWPREYSGASMPIKAECRIWWHRGLLWVAGLGPPTYFLVDRVSHFFGFCIGF